MFAMHAAGGSVDGERSRWHLAVVASISLCLLLLVYFDLQSDIPYMDEYARQWSLQHLQAGQGLPILGSNPALVQILAAAPLALAHTAPRFWRLPQILFLLLLPIYSWKLSRRLGASQFWAAVGAAAMVCSPLTLGIATGMMNDTAYIGLLAAGAWYMLEWMETGRGRLLFIVMAALATLQRLQGLGLVLTLTLGLAIQYRRRGVTMSEGAALAASWIITLMALAVPEKLMRFIVTPSSFPHQATGFSYWAYTLIELPVMGAFFLLPFAIGLLRRRPWEREAAGHTELIPTAIGVAGVLGGAMLLLIYRAMVFPGIWVAFWGLGPAFLGDIKPAFWPAPAFLAVEVMVLLCVAVVFVWRRRAWVAGGLGLERLLLLALAGSQLAAVLGYIATYDRFYLPVFVPVVPVVASFVVGSKGPMWPARAWAITLLLLWAAVYLIGEQDYVAWQTARRAAAAIAYRTFPPSQVAAGFEEEANYVWLPAAAAPFGALPRHVVDCPRAALVWALAGDPRPGVDYRSVRPGRIVVVRTSCR